jgi:hypothetical protein
VPERDAREVMEIRLRAKASNAKSPRDPDDHTANAALCAASSSSAAARTAVSGRGVQVQNPPRVQKEFSPDTLVRMALKPQRRPLVR